MARKALIRAKVKHGAILLVSDLDDASSDEGLLTAEALRLRADAHTRANRALVRCGRRQQLLHSALRSERDRGSKRVHSHRKAACCIDRRPAPWPLLLLGALLVVLLAGNERWNGRLQAEGATA